MPRGLASKSRQALPLAKQTGALAGIMYGVEIRRSDIDLWWRDARVVNAFR